MNTGPSPRSFPVGRHIYRACSTGRRPPICRGSKYSVRHSSANARRHQTWCMSFGPGRRGIASSSGGGGGWLGPPKSPARREEVRRDRPYASMGRMRRRRFAQIEWIRPGPRPEAVARGWPVRRDLRSIGEPAAAGLGRLRTTATGGGGGGPLVCSTQLAASRPRTPPGSRAPELPAWQAFRNVLNSWRQGRTNARGGDTVKLQQ